MSELRGTPKDCALLLRGGTVIDGTGAARYVADVRVEGARISEIGRDLPARGAAALDVAGRVVCPGFIDVHTPDHQVVLSAPEMLARVAAEAGGIYTTHIRDEGVHVIESLDEAFRTAEQARIPVVISHHKCSGPENWGRSVATLAHIRAARRKQPVGLDAYPYIAGSTILRSEAVDGIIDIMVSWSEPHPEMSGRMLADIALDWQCTQQEACERLKPGGAIYFQMREDDVRRVLQFEATMIGSDGLPHDTHPHPRLWGTFPRVLGHYARDGGLFPLEEAVHRMTGLSARQFNLKDRGEVAVGQVADLVVFNPVRIIDRATFENPTLPAAGIDLVIVDGIITFRDGRSTGMRAGRFLRRDASA